MVLTYEQTKYCEKCGSLLIETDDGITSYDIEHGYPLHRFIKQCPKYGYGFGHTLLLSSRRPSTILKEGEDE